MRPGNPGAGPAPHGAGEYGKAGAAEQILSTLAAWASRQAAEAAEQDRPRWQELARRYAAELRAFRATDAAEVERIIREYGPAARDVVEGGR
jgi:hypothetical protein